MSLNSREEATLRRISGVQFDPLPPGLIDLVDRWKSAFTRSGIMMTDTLMMNIYMHWCYENGDLLTETFKIVPHPPAEREKNPLLPPGFHRRKGGQEKTAPTSTSIPIPPEDNDGVMWDKAEPGLPIVVEEKGPATFVKCHETDESKIIVKLEGRPNTNVVNKEHVKVNYAFAPE